MSVVTQREIGVCCKKALYGILSLFLLSSRVKIRSPEIPNMRSRSWGYRAGLMKGGCNFRAFICHMGQSKSWEAICCNYKISEVFIILSVWNNRFFSWVKCFFFFFFFFVIGIGIKVLIESWFSLYSVTN